VKQQQEALEFRVHAEGYNLLMANSLPDRLAGKYWAQRESDQFGSLLAKGGVRLWH